MGVPADTKGDNFFVEAYALLAVALVIVFIRCFARLQQAGLRQLKLDDWMMKAAVVRNGIPNGVREDLTCLA
jgi:hypothetical protein